MGTETKPFLGLGYMLKRGDVPDEEFDALYNELIEFEFQEPYYARYIDVTSDLYCGNWVFIGEYEHGDTEDIVKLNGQAMYGNGDDLDLELIRQLGEDHPFKEKATFGLYFGTNWL